MIALLDRPHTEARALLATGAPVYLPVNPVEYHGPHLPLHTDALISEGLARDLHAALSVHHPEWPLLMATNLEAGVDPAPGPGSRAVPYGTTKQLVVRSCRALAELGAQRVVLMTFHGSPLHNLALEAGIRALKKLGVPAISPFNLVLASLLRVDPALAAKAAGTVAHLERPADRERLAANLDRDFHAGFFETSLVLHYQPDSVSPSHKNLPPCPPLIRNSAVSALARAARSAGKPHLADELSFAALAMGWYALRPFPGYTGEPHLANARSGEIFARELVRIYAERTEAVLVGGEAPPPPIMPWTSWLTFGGRVGALDVPLAEIARPAPITP